MASRHRQVEFLAAAAIVVAFLPALGSAVDHVVGDGAGWTLNYTIGWPEGKTFKVGDNLVFKYPNGNHTVMEVDGQTFRECYRQGNTISEWTSGNDTVKLDKPGRRWFFCGVADHCELGLKLVVNVVVGEAPLPTPPPQQSPPGNPGSPPSPNPSPPAAPSTPTEPSTSSSSSSAASTERMTAVEAVARAMVAVMAVAGCFI